MGDHPRSRGEYSLDRNQAVEQIGSSPLSRGILLHEEPLMLENRIIPALAGNTRIVGIVQHPNQDHPRSRGEYSVAHGMADAGFGSSPLSRGIHPHRCSFGPAIRIIPALAGNTPGRAPARTCSSDHPRSRGEYVATREFCL